MAENDPELLNAVYQEVSEKLGCETDIMVTEKDGKLVGLYFDSNPHIFSGYDYIIGATDYSLVTTIAAKTAINNGSAWILIYYDVNNGSIDAPHFEKTFTVLIEE